MINIYIFDVDNECSLFIYLKLMLVVGLMLFD